MASFFFWNLLAKLLFFLFMVCTPKLLRFCLDFSELCWVFFWDFSGPCCSLLVYISLNFPEFLHSRLTKILLDCFHRVSLVYFLGLFCAPWLYRVQLHSVQCFAGFSRNCPTSLLNFPEILRIFSLG